MRRVTAQIDPGEVERAFRRFSAALAELAALGGLVREEPVFALALNKAADRITAMKFEEMRRNPREFGTADQQMREITRWFRESVSRGRMLDPDYPDLDRAPYRGDWTPPLVRPAPAPADR